MTDPSALDLNAEIAKLSRAVDEACSEIDRLRAENERLLLQIERALDRLSWINDPGPKLLEVMNVLRYALPIPDEKENGE